MRKLMGVLAGALILFSASVAFADWPKAQMNRQIDQTNFVVNEGCSGTLISLTDRYVLTAAHCVGDQYETVEQEEISDSGEVTKKKVRRLKPGTVTQLFFKDAAQINSAVYRTKLIQVARDKDLALLQIVADIPNTQASPLACTRPERGDKAYVVGNPMGSLYSSVNVGIVSSTQRTYETLRFPTDKPEEALMQVSAGVIGGNSGGSVYNENGELIGVPVLANRTNEVLGFAVPLDVIKTFLNGKVEDNCKKETK